MAGVPIAVVPSENEIMNSASTDTYNAEDYEWKDDHLGLDLSRVPTQPRDPPVEASLEELKAAWQRTWQDITQERMWSDDHCAEINGKIRQLLRLNERVRNIVLCEEEPRELPAEMNFDEGYDHLTEQQRAYMKKMLAPEGSFFMKGKYPKTVRTSPVIIDVQGAPPKASGYQRLSEKEQEVVNQYVENLVAADVVEPCSGQWSSPILLVPKKDGSLRAVADLRKVNKCVVADSYAMPDTQDLLDQLAESVWFSSIDLSSAFWQLPLAEESRDCALESPSDGFQKLVRLLPASHRSSAWRLAVYLLCCLHQ